MPEVIDRVEIPVVGLAWPNTIGNWSIPVRDVFVFARNGDWILTPSMALLDSDPYEFIIRHAPTGLAVGVAYTSIRKAKADLKKLPSDSGFSPRPRRVGDGYSGIQFRDWQNENNGALDALKPKLSFLYDDSNRPWVGVKSEAESE